MSVALMSHIVQLALQMKRGGYTTKFARLQFKSATKSSPIFFTDCPTLVMSAGRLGFCPQDSQTEITVVSVRWRLVFGKDYQGRLHTTAEREKDPQGRCSRGELTCGHTWLTTSSNTHNAALSLLPCKLANIV